MIAVTVENIVKNYDEVEALCGVSFQIERGEIFGIIGSDGSGKSTLFRILTTLLLAESGSAWVDGYDVVADYKQIRARVGYMPGRFSLYQDLSVEENLHFFAALFDTTVEQNYDLIRDIYIHLEPFKKRRAGRLSGGMKQKLALCCALIHRPSVLFLDEPTTGVDPVSRREFWHILHRLKESGITILVSTPYMDEAQLCDRIALINRGRFLTIDSPQRIISNFGEPLWAVSASSMPKLLHDLRVHRAVKSCYAFGGVHHITMREPISQVQLRDYLQQQGDDNIEICQIEATVEDCFIKLSQ